MPTASEIFQQLQQYKNSGNYLGGPIISNPLVAIMAMLPPDKPKYISGQRVLTGEVPMWTLKVQPTTSKTLSDGSQIWTEHVDTARVGLSAEQELINRGIIQREDIPFLRRLAIENTPKDTAESRYRWGEYYAKGLQEFLRKNIKKIPGL